jgi:hypothetical protein
MKRYRQLIVALCALGFVAACTCASYLYFSYPDRNPRIVRVLSLLCPPSSLDAWFVDMPDASIVDQCVLWLFIALINAALYGAVGVFCVKLGQLIGRKSLTRS